MAILLIKDEGRKITEFDEAKRYLADIGIGYEVWNTVKDLDQGVTNEQVLEAFAKEIEELKAQGGFVTADVIDVSDQTPGLDAMLNKFNKEHWHDEDEVRFIIEGHGVFHIRPKDGSPVVGILVGAGDLIRVPAGTWHWFDLMDDRRIRAIRLFQDMAGWTPYYTESGVDKGYLPVCFGLSFIPAQLQAL